MLDKFKWLGTKHFILLFSLFLGAGVFLCPGYADAITATVTDLTAPGQTVTKGSSVPLIKIIMTGDGSTTINSINATVSTTVGTGLTPAEDFIAPLDAAAPFKVFSDQNDNGTYDAGVDTVVAAKTGTALNDPAPFLTMMNNIGSPSASGTFFIVAFVSSTATTGHAFTMSLASNAIATMAPGGAPSIDPITTNLVTIVAAEEPPAPETPAAVSNVGLSDVDSTGYGLDGRDFRVTWTPTSTQPLGYQFTKIYITTSGLQLAENTLDSTGCNGSPCQPVGFFNQFTVATHTLQQFMKKDSAGVSWATSSEYVAWLYTSATQSSLASSTAATTTFDVVSDTNAPQIDHSPVHTAKAGAAATLHAFIFDDQTESSQFANTGDGGEEYFRLKYGADVSAASTVVNAAIVSGAGELYSFTIPVEDIPVAGQRLEYYLIARDSATTTANIRYFCAMQSPATENDCKDHPFVINSVSITGDGRTISGVVNRTGGTLSGATIFAGGFAGLAATTTGDGTYSLSGLPNNDVVDITATKVGFAKAVRMETIGTADKSNVNLFLNEGSFGFYVGEGGQGGEMGGAPRMMFSGPPDGMQGFPISEAIRMGFNQPMDATTITTISSATSSNVYLIKTASGENVPGTAIYCSNKQAAGCSALFDMDTNTILFTPSTTLATSTQYTFVVTEKVKSSSGQVVQGNRSGGGHKISFSTMSDNFSFNQEQWATKFSEGKQYMPPFVKSMSPAPGMNASTNVNVLLEFNQALKSDTVNGTNITLDKISASDPAITVSLDSNEKRFVTIDPTSNLTAGEYEVKIYGAVSSAGGVPMRNDTTQVAFSSRFRVEATAGNDTATPTLYAALSDNSTNVATNKVFEFGVSEGLSVSTVNISNITMYRGSTAVSVNAQFDPGKNSIFVAPVEVLIPNTVYTLTFGSGITDLAGNALTTSTYTYTTGSADSVRPQVKEAFCDDYRCEVVFSEPMNHDTADDATWTNSVLNSANWTISQIDAEGIILQTETLTSKVIGYDPVRYSAVIEGLSIFAANDYFKVTAGENAADLSDNTIATSSNQNIYKGTVKDSKQTFGMFGGEMGMFGPPTGEMFGQGGQVGQGEFKPQGFGNFTADQFGMGQADMAYPFNPMAGVDSNVFQVRFTPGSSVSLQTGDQVVLTFPNGTDVSNVSLDTYSPYYTDFNQFAAGTVSSTGLTSSTANYKVTITLGVSGSPSGSDPVTIDLRKIINPTIPKGPATGGYNVNIKVMRSGQVLADKTSVPYYIMAGGSNTLTVDVVAGTATSTPDNNVDGRTANGTVYLHGGGPGGPMDKVLTMANGDISAVDGTAATSIIYSNLPNGCYGVGTEPYITLGGNDYYGQMSPEPICLNNGESKTKWILLTPASVGNTANVTVKWTGKNFGGKDIDIFAGGPNKFVVKTVTGATTAPAEGYTIKLNANGNWFVGMGPAMSKSSSGGMVNSLGIMPPPSLNIKVSNIETTPVLTVVGGTPPGVSYSNGTITYTFATADKTIEGTVKDGSGNALANVEVFLSRQGFGSPMFTQTNASGQFSFSVGDYGNYEIGARKDGMPTIFKNIEVRNVSNVAKIYVDGQDKTGNFTLNLKKSSYTISGKVLDSVSGGNGIAYAPVMAVDANGNTVFGQTSSDGSYTLFVDAGNWTLRAELPPSKTDSCGTFTKSVEVSLSTGSQSNQNITPTVSTCYTLSGTITVSTTLANVPVFIEQWDNTNNRPLAGGAKKPASTDSSGVYSVKVGAGNYRIGTWHPDYGELSVTTTVSGDVTDAHINYAAESMSSVTFTFTGGTSAMNGFIELKNSADANKRFGKPLNGLASSVVMAVPASTDYSYFIDVFGVGKFTGTTTAGDTETINLGLDSGFITVTGTVYTDASTSTGKAGALVTFSNASTTVSAVADADGDYSVSIKAGTYVVSESLAGHVSPLSASVSFTTSTPDYDFGGASPDQSALQVATWVVTGTVYASNASPMSEGFVWGTNSTGTVVSSPINSTDGSYSLPVTAGVWTIKAVGPKHVETTLSPAVTVTNANQTGKNITLTTAGAGVNVATSTTGIVTASSGGSLNDTAASGIKLTAGAGVLETGSGDVTLNFEKNFTAPDTKNYQALGNASFSIEATGNSTIKSLNGNAEITLDYTSLLASLPAGVSEGNLQLAYYSPERDEYVPVEGGFTVDATNNTITGLVSHFTDFVITYRNNDAGVTVTEVGGATAVTEGGVTDSITYVLTSAPTANVVITPTASGAKVTLSPTTLTFTSGNWSTPQTLTVTAVDDATVESTHTDTLTHVITSDDANYAGVSISNITVTITDNDSSPGGGSSGGGSADTTPPTNTSVVIAAGATSTAGTAVTLTLGATDAAHMMIGNDSAFTSSTWEVYATTKSWTLTSGAGTKTVYAKFRDTAGNASSPVSDSIVLLDFATTTTPTTSTTPATTTAPVMPAPVVTPAPAPVEPTTAVVLKPSSKVVVSDGIKLSYQPGAKLKFNYQYKNTSKKSENVKIIRQLLDSKGKVVKSATALKIIKPGAAFKGSVDEVLAKTLKAGTYTVKVKVMYTNNKLIDDNSFKIQVEKLKRKYIVLDGDVPEATDIALDKSAWLKNKTNVTLPVTVKGKYSYTNSTDKKHTVRMVRELLDGSGKVMAASQGKWSMEVAEKDSQTFAQTVKDSIDPGSYSIRIRAYDWTSKELLAENSIGFRVELK